MPNASILITRPNHDLINVYFFKWTQQVIEQANRQHIKVLDLDKDNATKQKFTSYVKKHNPKLIFMNGHGNEMCIAGYRDEVIIESGVNERLLTGKIIYIRSCNVAAKLGRACIQSGTRAFLGYLKKYSLGYTPSSAFHPLEDKVAKLFLEPSNLIPISLIKGNSVKNAYRKSQTAMLKNFLFMLSTKATKEQRDAAPSLWRNRKYQVVLGNENTRI
ncbi:hypothetical protein KJ980_06910 [Patescibacteria group bacterium]|nr:hypothetical protein [Patescibacteria group bacterium]MBU4016542.1 hypothetical protein [Patescibacteria group bacterium]MBU4099351.1 hypothetical protein [Patescibacteria group bacterium]